VKTILSLTAFLAAAFGVAAFGAQFAPGQWYEELSKPPWNPPKWVFGPVWTVLYCLIGVSGWLVWRRSGATGTWLPFSVYALQLVLNAAWSWIFFGLHKPWAAFAEILVLWTAILVNTILVWRVSPLAAALLLPYLAWVGLACGLNWKLWRLNA
jgi:benzodiazapine receptor